MYQNQSRGSSKITGHFGLKQTSVYLLLFYALFIAQWAKAEISLHSTNSVHQCDYKIHNIEKVKDPQNQSTPPQSGWTKTTMPNIWTNDPGWEKYSGAVWYRIIWDRHCINQASHNLPTLLSIARISLAGNIYNNGELIWYDQSLQEPYSRSFNIPRYITFPASTIKDEHNVTLIKVVGLYATRPGIGRVNIGLKDDIYPYHQKLLWNNRTVYEINFVISLAFSVLFYLIWLFNFKETSFGWFASASLCWVGFLYNLLATSPFPFTDSVTPNRVNSIALLLHGYCFTLFTWRFVSKHYKKTERCYLILVLALSIYILLVPEPYLYGSQVIIFFIYISLFILNCIFIQYLAYAIASFEIRILALVLLTFILIAVNDIYLAFYEHSENFLAPYSSPIITIALSLIFAWRIFLNMRQIRKFTDTLKITIEQVTDDLKISLEKKYNLEVENMRLQERLNLSHELHDGLGGSLVRSMIMVDKNTDLDRNHFLSILKLLRSDLRQIIDAGANVSMELPKTPILWGAPLRHRFTQIFEEIDIDSTWNFSEKWSKTPTPQQCLTLSRVTEEALTNVIKHSKATEVSISLTDQAGKLVLEICDNGIGFDPSTVPESLHVGLQSMQTRVNRIGGEFVMRSQKGETIVQVIL